jgi:hypothetical protein
LYFYPRKGQIRNTKIREELSMFNLIKFWNSDRDKNIVFYECKTGEFRREFQHTIREDNETEGAHS